MYLVYSLAFSVLFCALLPYFIYQALRNGKYAGSFKERLGLLRFNRDDRNTIWVHAVSVGEFLAARTLTEKLKADFPAYRLVISTTTLTGQHLARASSNFDSTFYFPFDWKFAVRRALDRVNPSIVIILETELWPNFLRECRRRDVTVILANGRISERSFKRYRRVPAFIKRVVADFSLMIMQTAADADRAQRLGASHVQVCGNLKYDVDVEHPNSTDVDSPERAGTAFEVYRQFGLSSSPHLIIAGSTAPGEEEMLLKSFGEVRRHPALEDARMLLAPRHPERFSEVARMISRSGFTHARRSDSHQLSASTVVGGSKQTESVIAQASDQSDIILLDTIGELALLYRFAAVVFVGGSLVPRGGHNVIEPAAYAKPIIVGPYTENFREIVADFVRANALLQVEPRDLAGEFIHLLSNPEQASAMGERARNILIANRGATDCTMQAIKAVLASR